ncbi:MAG TPA: 16S rRNA (guanine(966)-N(2))-methyltransferase RsmD [Vicinamibacterales bacterium]
MRIIAGAFKGRRLATPTWAGLRPTSDRLRETLFNVLRDRTAGAHVLDACAGTGALGLEALSREAADVVFLEQDPRACRLIAKNLELCGASQRCAIIRAGVPAALARLAGTDRFDLILFDPPYEAPPDQIETMLAALGDRLTTTGMLVYEHAHRRAAPPATGAIVRTRELRSGDSALAFYTRSV